jgi:hypothetical protein
MADQGLNPHLDRIFTMIDRVWLGNDSLREPGRRPARLVAGTALAVFISALGGCSSGSAVGEGTIDVSSAKAALGSNPNIAKAAAARGKAGMSDAQKTRRK